ncbi:MAG TPA: DUF72 domain-containing protein [Anaerolineales bacterium]|nr:DUF72 domain-containing protein [Anaerolineales bacterium]HNN13403.1 DUF72 domain-containing protein [Anaerolineales bacterium]HNO30618.1 DUF72 domain-containing protein [Anaerolineales bacterium]
MTLYLGCPVWSFKGWVGNFYPKGTPSKDFLREYARRLNTIEGNTTFYAIPAPQTLQAWAESTPDSFRFCLKIPKAISHNGALADYISRAQGFVDAMRPLASRLGPMFLQLPPSYSPRLILDLAKFLDAFPKDIRLGVEVRHLDWFEDEHRTALNRLLSDRNMARVVIDTRPIRNLAGDDAIKGSSYESLLEARERKPDVPVFEEVTADFTFLRFIGHPGMEQNQPWVGEWVPRIAEQLSAGKEAFVFCHSPDNLLAPYIAREFHRQVSSHIEMVPMPWDELPPEPPRQGTLF